MENIILSVKQSLESNNMTAYAVETKEDAVNLLKDIVKEQSTVAVGGSVTLNELDVISMLRNGNYNFIDRYEEGISREEVENRFRQGLLADYFIMSSNAITEDGCLYNVDGNGNRVAALCYGPKNVIVIAGKNKIVKDLNEAQIRVKTIATPKNCQRLGINSYCSNTEKCLSLSHENPQICDGCKADSRICCTYVISAMQRVKGRITVILVNEELGYWFCNINLTNF